MSEINVQENKTIEKLDLSISELNLSTRAFNVLRRRFWPDVTIRNLLSIKYDDLKKINGLGKETLLEIIYAVHSMGLRFDFEISDDIVLEPKTLEDCLFLYKKNLIKIKEKTEKKRKLEEEICQLFESQNYLEEKIGVVFQEEKNAKILSLLDGNDYK